MFLTKIYKRYLFFDALKFFLLTLVALFAFFVLIDYSQHAQEFVKDSSLTPLHLLIYYAALFSSSLHVFLPIALLLSCVKVLTKRSKHLEILALLASGIKYRSILSPFILLSFLISCSVLALNETALHAAANHVSKFERRVFARKDKPGKQKKVDTIYFSDGTQMIYSKFDKTAACYKDCYWVVSSDEMWHMESLYLSSTPPFAASVEHFKRNANGSFERKSTFPTKQLGQMGIAFEMSAPPIQNLSSFSLQELLKPLQDGKGLSGQSQNAIYTHLLHKALLPLIPILIVLCVCPYAISHVRKRNLFLLYAGALGSVFVYFMLSNGLVVLGENEVVHPLIATLLLPTCFLLIFGRKYISTRT